MVIRKNPIASKLEELTRKLVDSYTVDQAGSQPIDLDISLPSRTATIRILDRFMSILYPGYHSVDHLNTQNVSFHVGALLDDVSSDLSVQLYRAFEYVCRNKEDHCQECADKAEKISLEYFDRIPEVRKTLMLDVEAAFDGDPAAKSSSEVIFAYPGLFATTVYRLAHELHLMGVPLLPRMMTEYAHSQTGIDIHPGAEIGTSFFIDHGTGVVIGETSEIGKHVRIYQGVTLGGLSFPKDEKGKLVRGKKRHPTICDQVVIYAGATILGGETIIGEGAVIGGNTWVVESVPPHTKVLNESRSSRIERKQKK